MKEGIVQVQALENIRLFINETNNTSNTYYVYEFDVFTFRSLNWLYYLFYENGRKVIKPELINYLTPMSIALSWMTEVEFLVQKVS